MVSSRRFAVFFAISVLFACNGPGADLGQVLGRDFVDGPQGEVPSGVDPDRGAGSGCHNDDPNHICLALKLVTFKDSAEVPAVPEDAAVTLVQQMNSVYKTCNLSFQIDEYAPIKPADYGLAYQTANYTDLTKIRNTFADARTLLLVVTGPWNRSGTLGNTGANAWTAMPGGGPYGAIVEKSVGMNANLVGHELGHYLNLMHSSDSANFMNPIVYSRSTGVYSSQCDTMRSAAKYFWTKMIR